MAFDILKAWDTGDINARVTSAVAVINDNGLLKVVAPIQHGVKCYDAKGHLLWTYSSITNGYDVRHIAVGNLNGTGYNDCSVVCSGYYNTATDGKVAILDKDGNALQLLLTSDFGGTAPSQARYAVVDGTDIYITTNLALHKFTKSGSTWSESWRKDLGNCQTIQIADLGNGKRIYVDIASVGLNCYQTDGTLDWAYSNTNQYQSVFAIGKLDSTKTGNQIVLPYQSGGVILDKDGNSVGTFSPSNVGGGVTCYDCDGDGEDEFYFTDMARDVYCYERTGVNTYSQKYSLLDVINTSNYAGLAHFDINEDGDDEIFIFTTDGHCYIYDKTLATLVKDLNIGHGSAGGNWATASTYQCWQNGICFNNLVGDSAADLIIAGSTGYVDVFEASDTTNTLIDDLFTDADNTSLDAHIAPSNFTWTEYDNASQDFKISSSQIVCVPSTSASGSSTARAEYDLGIADMYAQIKVNTTFTSSYYYKHHAMGVAVRFDSSANTCYVAWLGSKSDGTSSTVYEIGKYVNNTFTSLYIGNYSWSAGDILKLEVAGDTLTLYVNGAQQYQLTDSSIATGTRAGIASRVDNYDVNAIGDDFEASVLSASVATTDRTVSTKTRIKLTGINNTVSEKARILSTGKTSIISTKARIKISDIEKTVDSKAKIYVYGSWSDIWSYTVSPVTTNTNTISVKARIKGTGFTETISARARVKIAQTSKTVSTKARIKKVEQSTTVGAKTRLRGVQTATVGATARILSTGIASTIGAKTRIKISEEKSVTSKARLKVSSTTKLVSAKVRILSTGVADTISTKARVKTQQGTSVSSKARIKLSHEVTISSKASISALVQEVTIRAKARIKKIADRTLTSKGRVLSTGTSKNISTRARIAKSSSKVISALSRIIRLLQKNVSALARVKSSGEITTASAKARLIVTTSKTVSAKSRIKVLLEKEISSKSRILLETEVTTSSKARLKSTGNTVSISAKADIKVTNTATESSKARIKNTLEKVISARSRITNSFETYISALARVQKQLSKTITTKARIRSTGSTKAITSRARIQIVSTKTIDTKARIRKLKQQVASAKALVVIRRTSRVAVLILLDIYRRLEGFIFGEAVHSNIVAEVRMTPVTVSVTSQRIEAACRLDTVNASTEGNELTATVSSVNFL